MAGAVTLCLLTAVAWSTGAARAGATSTAVSASSTGSDQAAALVAAFAAFKGIPAADVGALRPGSLHTAYDPSTAGYWGTASFLPAAGAGDTVAVKFQDGGGVGVFRSSDGTTWTMTRVGGQPFPCAGDVPVTVEAAWGLTNSPFCATSQGVAAPHLAAVSASASTAISPIGEVATTQVGIGDTPASTNFSLDCDPYTTLVGGYGSSAGCGIDPHFGVRNKNEFWCADFAKWVWERGGVTTNLATLTPAAASFYTWGAKRGEALIPDGNNPAVGDAVVFYPPGALTASGLGFADHVAIVVGVNPDGTVNLVNGDFGGTTNISVQLFNDVSIRSWASFIWSTGEQWVYVAPGAGLTGGNGVPSGTPASLALSASLMNVFFQTQTGRIENEYWTPTTNWRSQILPGGTATGDPAAVANSSTAMNVFYVTTGGKIVRDFWNPTAGWRTQTLPGGNAVGDVAAVVNSPSLMNVFYTTPQGRIANDYLTPATGWVNRLLPGGYAASAPTAVANTSTWMNLFYTTKGGGIGLDYWRPTLGWVNQALPGSDATGAPMAVVNSPTWMNVWYTTLDGQVDNLSWKSGTGWVTQGLPSSEATGAPFGVINSPNVMSVWYATNEGQLVDVYWTPTTGWVNRLLPSFEVTGAPSAVANSASWSDVFYVTVNGRIANDWWMQATGWHDQLLPP